MPVCRNRDHLSSQKPHYGFKWRKFSIEGLILECVGWEEGQSVQTKSSCQTTVCSTNFAVNVKEKENIQTSMTLDKHIQNRFLALQ